MGESKKNLATDGLMGQVGNFVFRRRRVDGKIFVSRHPGEQEAEPTEAQLSVREKFQQAAIYGRAAVSNPETKAEYAAAAKPGQSAYNVAVADFFRAPDIEEVDLSAYAGQVGDVIRIKATDNFKVQQVKVRIENADASLIEEGQAAADADGRSWTYTATAVNESLTGDKITVTATDRPQNVTREEQVLE
ncbi:MAG: hypothetical protein AB2L20_02805 [Mangrovibacterium sp.]